MKSEEVAQYLQENPQFFEEYADMISHMLIPHPHGGRTISITERQMLSLRDKNKQLEGKMGELLQFGGENDIISEKIHRLAVAVIAAGSFQAVVHSLNSHLRDDFSIPYFALRLWHRPENVIVLPEFAAVSAKLQDFADTLTQPYCGSTADFETASWFGAAAPKIRSQGLIALRNGNGTIGMVALGSEDPQRFYTNMGTLYLERLGEIASAALARVMGTS